MRRKKTSKRGRKVQRQHKRKKRKKDHMNKDGFILLGSH